MSGICRSKKQVYNEEGKLVEEPPKKEPKKDRATLEKEYKEAHDGVFTWTPVNWAIVVVLFVPFLWFAYYRYRSGAQINNSLIQYGNLLPHRVTYAYWVICSFIVSATCVTWVAKLGTKMLTFRGLWLAYFLIGTGFNLVAIDQMPVGLESEHQTGMVRHTGFIMLSWMHLIIEMMLTCAVFVPKSKIDWYWTRIFVYGWIINFLACASRQKTFSIYILVGGMGSLPSDTMTLIAGYAIWRRAKDPAVKMLAVGWALHMPGILLILSFMNYGSTVQYTLTGFALAFVQFQYCIVVYSLSKVVMLRDLPDDELEKELREKGVMAPDPDLDKDDEETGKNGALMEKPTDVPEFTLKWALFQLFNLVQLLSFIYVLVPLLCGPNGFLKEPRYLYLQNFIE